MKDKYISFSPWWGGWSNQKMSYETAAAISVITGRKLILPHKEYCLFFSNHHDKSTFLNFWNILDKEAFKSNFDTIDFFDVPEYRNIGSDVHYFAGIGKIAKIITFQNHEYSDWEWNIDPSVKEVMVCNITDEKDFEHFRTTKGSYKRKVIDLNVSDKFIHFPRNLFAHYYFHVYGASPIIRNNIKRKIRDGIKFKPEYYSMAKIVTDKIGKYNAVHIRSGDFNRTQAPSTEHTFKNMKALFDSKLNNDLPVYIATDETDRNKFKSIIGKYEVYFLSDFFNYLDDYEKLALDYINCINADIFLGSQYSTFTDGINCFRGFEGKKDFHKKGINFDNPPVQYDRFTWENEFPVWHTISENHWKFEEYA